MPTGYTAGILDGTINTFPEFAKICMRAMGATIMMRDEPLSAEYKPREVSDYHQKEIDKANAKLNEKLSDEELVKSRIEELNKEKE